MFKVSTNGKGRRILITGLPYFARRIGNVLTDGTWRAVVITPLSFRSGQRRSFERARLLASMPFCDLIYQIGGSIIDPRILKLSMKLHRPVVLHWVGSDVCEARSKPLARTQNATGRIIHWADAPWLQAELSAIGISSIIMPSSTVTVEPTDWPSAGPFSVLLYLPDSRWEFYRGPSLVKMAAQLPSMDFYVVGSNGAGRQTAPNIRYLGWVTDIAPIYSRCHALVRMPIHDGLSAMVVESLARGRYVIWNYSLPSVLTASNENEIQDHLLRLEREHQDGVLQLNEPGQNYAQTKFSEPVVAGQLRRGFEDLSRQGLQQRVFLETL